MPQQIPIHAGTIDTVDMDGEFGCPALWIPAYAGMTVRAAGNDGAAVVDSGSSPGRGVLGAYTGWRVRPASSFALLRMAFIDLYGHAMMCKINVADVIQLPVDR